MDDNHKWPELPKVLRAQHAYGVLEVLAGEITQEDREIMDPEELEDMPKKGGCQA